jgi:hypothetical protein
MNPLDLVDGKIVIVRCKKTRDKDLLEKWQILGLLFMIMSEPYGDFYHLVKQEFGCISDSKGWIKAVNYQ